MEYENMDIMLKYQLALERKKSIYYGDPTIYNDGRLLETFPEEGDKINGKKPLFVIGTVVYMHYKDKFLMLRQTKEDRVVDTLVGLGGKMRPIIGSIVPKTEKNNIDDVLWAFETGNHDLAEDQKAAAAREVQEETATYKKDSNGQYTHEIERPGVYIDPKLLNDIGVSRIRIIRLDRTECWLIYNYVYDVSENFYNFMNEYVSRDNREGHLEWLTLDEALPNMSNADKIILKNHDKKVRASEIRDMVNNHNITRVVVGENSQYCETVIDGNISYSSNNINTESVAMRK